MKLGDLLIILPHTHSYPEGSGTEKIASQYYQARTPAIYLTSVDDRVPGLRRIFFQVITPYGIHIINSAFIEEVR